MSVETHAQRGKFVTMEGGATPLEQAEIFNVSAASSIEPAQPLLDYLTMIKIVDSELLKDLPDQNSVLELNRAAATTQSAQNLREVFGEVKAEDRNYLPLVKVYFDLFHNWLEAQYREQAAKEAAMVWVAQVVYEIQTKIRELQAQLQSTKEERQQDNHQKTIFQAGVEVSYHEAQGVGENGLNQYQNIISEEEDEINILEKELKNLRDLEERLVRFCSYV